MNPKKPDNTDERGAENNSKKFGKRKILAAGALAVGALTGGVAVVGSMQPNPETTPAIGTPEEAFKVGEEHLFYPGTVSIDTDQVAPAKGSLTESEELTWQEIGVQADDKGNVYVENPILSNTRDEYGYRLEFVSPQDGTAVFVTLDKPGAVVDAQLNFDLAQEQAGGENRTIELDAYKSGVISELQDGAVTLSLDGASSLTAGRISS
ncbi:MAG: hypothetical protein QG553_131 [Patescibacteria group bacterium]|nr:hypothetical protein [Patescibacteria group bacterium]